MNGVIKDGWMSLLATALGGAFFGVIAASIWWTRRNRRSRTIVGQSGKKIKVYHTPTFRSARVTWMIAGKTRTCIFAFLLRDAMQARACFWWSKLCPVDACMKIQMHA